MIFEPFIPHIFEGEIEDFVSPAVDTLNAKNIQRLLRREFNVLQIITRDDGRAVFRNMIERGLIVEGRKGVLILEQTFKYGGHNLSRIGVIGIIKLEDEGRSLIPHESTLPEFVEQRRLTFERIKSQVEPIFVVSPVRKFEELLRNSIQHETPDFLFTEPKGVKNAVYLVENYREIREIQGMLINSNGYIADGHHRLQALKDINKKRKSRGEGEYHALAYVTSMFSDSLLISGIHRVVDLKEEGKARKELGKYFRFSKPINYFPGKNMAIYDGAYKEILPTATSSTAIINSGIMNPVYTDYSDLLILPAVLSNESMKRHLTFTSSQREAVNMVDSGRGDFAILIPSWSKNTFLKIVESGRILPPKSTFFFPKIPAGIAIYKMD